MSRRTPTDAPTRPERGPEAAAGVEGTDSEEATEVLEVAAPARSGHVRYIGGADIREITSKQLELVGFPGLKSVAWSAHNGFKVPLADFSDWPKDLFDRVVVMDALLVVEEDE